MSDRPKPNPQVVPRRWAWAGTLLGLVIAAGLGFVLVTRATDTAKTVDADAVQRATQMGKPMVVEFGASACASCRAMKPILETLQRDHGERIAVLNIDILKERGYASRYRIQIMPTQVFFDAHGREIGRNVGPISGPEILAQLGVTPVEPVR
jgi:thioredoxin 1